MSARFSPQSFPVWALLLVVAGLLLVYMEPRINDPLVGDLEETVMAELSPGTEAREWLASGQAFAPDRFRTPSDAHAFVDELYMQGALAVYVPRTDSETMVVELPEDVTARAAIFRLHQREGAEPTPDWGQEKLVFHWGGVSN